MQALGCPLARAVSQTGGLGVVKTVQEAAEAPAKHRRLLWQWYMVQASGLHARGRRARAEMCALVDAAPVKRLEAPAGREGAECESGPTRRHKMTAGSVQLRMTVSELDGLDLSGTLDALAAATCVFFSFLCLTALELDTLRLTVQSLKVSRTLLYPITLLAQVPVPEGFYGPGPGHAVPSLKVLDPAQTLSRRRRRCSCRRA